MFVYNIKFSSGKIFKIILFFIIVIALVMTGISIYKTFSNNSSTQPNLNEVYNITSTNYTNILKAVHENINTYIGQKINFSGYVYRVYDFEADEFVLARDMIVSSDMQTLIVGFLCKSEAATNFEDGTWVNITGEIKKGYYHGDIPIIEVTAIEQTTKPSDSYVYPPDDFYIPTSTLIYNNP